MVIGIPDGAGARSTRIVPLYHKSAIVMRG
jgi:hypothetical protein